MSKKNTSKKNTSNTTSNTIKLIKSYTLSHDMNQVKLDQLFQMYAVYQEEYVKHTQQYWKDFIKNQGNQNLQSTNSKNQFSSYGSTKHIPTRLSAALLQSLLNQSCSSLNAYLSHLEKKFSQILNKSSIKDPTTLHQIRTINQQHAWLMKKLDYYPYVDKINDEGKMVQVKQATPIPDEILKLARKIFHHVIEKRVKFPSMKNPRFIVDGRMAELQTSHNHCANNDKNSQQPHFTHWLNIITLVKGQRIQIPLKTYAHFLNAPGVVGNSIELIFREKLLPKKFKNASIIQNKIKDKNKDHGDGYLKDHDLKKKIKNQSKIKYQLERSIKIIFNKKSDVPIIDVHQCKNKMTQLKREVAMDIGLSHLIGTSDGELLGNNWLKKLMIFDKKMTNLLSHRQYCSSQYDKRLKAQAKQQAHIHVNEDFKNKSTSPFNQPSIEIAYIEKKKQDDESCEEKINKIVKVKKLNKEEFKSQSLDKEYKKLAQSVEQEGKLLRKTLKSPRYIQLTEQVRGFIKTEINRVLNLYFKTHTDIKTLVMEELNFHQPDLSPRMNRLIQNFGLTIVKQKIKELSISQGFKLEEINHAYTSQQCGNCGFVAKQNRSKQAKFQCVCCGFQLNADIQAARVILKRFQNQQGTAKSSLNRRELLQSLKSEFINKMNHDDSVWRKLRSRRNFTDFLKDKKTKNYFLTELLDFVLTT